MNRGLLARVNEALKAVIADVASNPRKLKPGEACRLLNSTPLGEVLTDRRLRDHRTKAGHRIGDDKTVDLVRYAAWLADAHHKEKRAIPQGTPTPVLKLARSSRISNADRMREVRRIGRVVYVPACEDPKRRKRLEKKVLQWLAWYFADIFDHPFTEQAKEMVQAICDAIASSGDQAIAASRGEGKTTLFECVLLYFVLTGQRSFAVLFCATGPDAERSLATIRTHLEENDRLLADYPEVCAPVRALEGTAQRARSQLVTGNRHDTGDEYIEKSSSFKWSGKEVFLPRVPGSPSSAAIFATRGLDGAVRGLKIGNRRPDVAGIDDPDTQDTVGNPDQGVKLEKKIDRGIAGLGGQKRRIARIMLTTIQRRGTVSHRFTDPEVKKSWHGKRFRFLVKSPEQLDLWDEYVQLKQTDWANEAAGKATRLAEQFYGGHFAAMNAGAVVANDYRRPGGERTALQFYFNEVARLGPEAVATEYDNDPPEESGPIESGITPHRVQRQLSGHARQVIPPGCILLTQGIDVRKVALHWVIRAWMPGAAGVYTIDYGVHEVLGTTYGSEEGLDIAVRRAILARIEATKATRYATSDGQQLEVGLTLVDAGWRTQAVYEACAEAGLGVMPVMGFGKSSGCVQANFSEVQKRTLDRKPGDGWFLSRKGKVWLVCVDTDRWKAWEHDRWMTSPAKPGCLFLFGEPGEPGGRLSDDEKGHHSYARHICNEVEVEELHRGAIRRLFKAKSENTHFLDGSYYCDVAANMKGIRLPGPQTAKPTQRLPGHAASAGPKPPAMSLAQMAAAAKGKR